MSVRARHMAAILLLAITQLVTLVFCAPQVAAAVDVASTPCCGVPVVPTAPDPDAGREANCTHCSNGIGLFAEARAGSIHVALAALPPIPFELAPPAASAPTERVDVTGWAAFRPPDESLLQLRCALIR